MYPFLSLNKAFIQVGLTGLITISLLSLSPKSAHADDADQELQNWDMVTIQVDAPHRISLYGEAQSRTGFQKDEALSNIIIRGAAGYRIKPCLSLWQGYGWTPSYRPHFNNENRIFQQVVLEKRYKKLGITNRTRLEERFIENAGGTSVRFRHQVKLAYALGQTKKWSLVGYDELFVNLNRTPNGPQGGYEQNRIFVGVNRRITEQINAEGGYLINHINRHRGTPDKMNHVILLTLNFSVK